ncbi:MAG: YggS family pyridoxal phosphate-dependent enzyme [Betaproteobacteria bacterium]|nr:YggS family pyridoxal phosphate-dependent enzyme [Betaproteobacteria bacterium]
MTTIAANLQVVRSRIARAARAAHRPESDIELLAVSKTWPAGRIIEAYADGQHAFGESYAQEAVIKITEVESLLARTGAPLRDLEWHFIGPVQSNKTRAIAKRFAWVHCVEREKTAVRLNDARPDGMPPLNVCIEVNVSGEASKRGIAPGGELALARAVARLPRLRLRGLMAIPEPTTDAGLQRRRFARLREMRDRLNAEGLALDTLSMGMSDDLESAILEGATIVRVGTAIFGQRAG